MTEIIINDYTKITNDLDSDYCYLMTLLYPIILEREENGWECVRCIRSKASEKSFVEAYEIMKSKLKYEDIQNESFEYVSWIKDVIVKKDEITLIPNNCVYDFLKKYKIDIDSLFC